jgi:hypothetical protein
MVWGLMPTYVYILSLYTVHGVEMPVATMDRKRIIPLLRETYAVPPWWTGQDAEDWAYWLHETEQNLLGLLQQRDDADLAEAFYGHNAMHDVLEDGVQLYVVALE